MFSRCSSLSSFFGASSRQALPGLLTDTEQRLRKASRASVEGELRDCAGPYLRYKEERNCVAPISTPAVQF